MLRSTQKSPGFTLLELMVSITIVVVLATIGFTLYTSAQKVARDAKRIGDLQETQKALEQYYSINRNYPPTAVSGLIKDVTGVGNSFPGYFENSIPPSDANPPYNWNYHYYNCPTAAQFKVCAKLEKCAGKCNVSIFPTDGCGQVGSFGSGAPLYCLGSLLN